MYVLFRSQDLWDIVNSGYIKVTNSKEFKTLLKSIKIHWGYVWFPENTKEKKNTKENDFFMFSCPMKNIKENQI